MALVLTNPFLAVEYGTSSIVAGTGDSEVEGDGTDVSASKAFRVFSQQQLAGGIEVGKRMPSTKVLSQADARPWHFQELLPSNGKWRVVIFAADVTKETQRSKLDIIGRGIAAKESFLSLFTPPGSVFDSVFDILAVHSAPRHSVDIFDFPDVFRHYDEVDGYDYAKIFADDNSYHEGHGKMYESYHISSEGCAVILRPDQYVSYVGPMDDIDALNKFFGGFMLSPLVKPMSDASISSGSHIMPPDSQAVDIRVA